ncbi:phage tail protein I [Luteimonas salinilitoris]
MTDLRDTETASRYLQYLPAPLQDGRFIGRFLLAFEAILSGGVVVRSEGGSASRQENATLERLQGLGGTLDEITAYFQPQETPPDFLPWLARWVAVDLREDWSELTRRNVVASIVPLYMRRGTRKGIEQAIRLCVSETADVRVDDSDSATYPYHFEVTLTIDENQYPSTLQQLYRKVEGAIELQKPAHTYYSLVLRYPSLVLLDQPDLSNPTRREMRQATKGIYVAMNTVLGSAPADMETGEKLQVPDS